MKSILITGANIVNEGRISLGDVLVENGRISKLGEDLSTEQADIHIDGTGKHLFPGLIDDQVHFREPGLTHKAEIYTEAKAGVAGGTTSYMEMPNTIPQATTLELLEQKYSRAAEVSMANYSFFMGATNSNLDEIMKVNFEEVCGLKIFQGSSTGNMVVDNIESLEGIFKECKAIIAIHSENDSIIKANFDEYKAIYGDDIPVKFHPKIRSEEACYDASSRAVAMAKKHGTRLHILHISTAKELELFTNTIPLEEKKVTAEACIHHMWFSEEDYDTKGNLIKWNPAVKTAKDREAIFNAMLDGTIDVVATDHAPHTLEEKAQVYTKAPSGGPLNQHSLVAMLDFYHQGKISLEKIALKMSHNVATLFHIKDRGFIKEGYYADLVLVDLNNPWKVEKENILSKCGWSPFEGHTFQSKVTHTVVSGHLAFENGAFHEEKKGERLKFSRKF
ncbi:dihydroorotase [Algoriphagus aquimarinus]|uniref:Dihydroorotase n=1 Tax=Algoriphagus aquimarinus TaxID=237018 RepID=A0A1I0WHP0_9BACT|nr:dihydroorotase [Algoriphagus aquimarinus]SFA88151.1 dihydroorotase [Algoriphagus aquimarinus]|tara:strand:- start:97112 stop:98455 length:1344 start_codon:yes stop_codon:yes gene_type:complete